MQEIKQMKADKEVFLKCLNDKQEELAQLTQKFTETETRLKKE
mgnify:CR=1 FL=1